LVRLKGILFMFYFFKFGYKIKFTLCFSLFWSILLMS
jgi:hypothetical protein